MSVKPDPKDLLKTLSKNPTTNALDLEENIKKAKSLDDDNKKEKTKTVTPEPKKVVKKKVIEKKVAVSSLTLEELLAENKLLLAKNKDLEKENEQLTEQLKWSDSTTSSHFKEPSMTVGQQKVYYSRVETMKAIFRKYADDNGRLSIYSAPMLHYELGEFIEDDEKKDILIQELKDFSAKINSKDKSMAEKVNFEQFLGWWISKYKKKHQKELFNLHGIELKNSGDFKIKKIKRKLVGKEETFAFRVRYYYKTKDYVMKQISPWHDIPLYNVGKGERAQLVTFLCEIPKWTRKKYELATREKFNPIKQDIKFGKLRYYRHGDLMFNYGLLPQTWENPSHVSKDTGKRGDNDPLDAIEIGTRQFELGEVSVVKVLGIIGLIDSEETDWKILCINIEDHLAAVIDDVDDIETYVPGCISAIREYFRVYKVCTGNEPNSFAFGEMPKGKKYALKVIAECHEFWKDLRIGNSDGVVSTPMPNKKVSEDTFDKK